MSKQLNRWKYSVQIYLVNYFLDLICIVKVNITKEVFIISLTNYCIDQADDLSYFCKQNQIPPGTYDSSFHIPFK